MFIIIIITFVVVVIIIIVLSLQIWGHGSIILHTLVLLQSVLSMKQ